MVSKADSFQKNGEIISIAIFDLIQDKYVPSNCLISQTSYLQSIWSLFFFPQIITVWLKRAVKLTVTWIIRNITIIKRSNNETSENIWKSN